MLLNVRGNLAQMDKGLSALCHWLSQSLNVLPPAPAISTGTFKWLRFRGDRAPNWRETQERWFKILDVMKLTVGSSALNVMGEIMGGNRSRMYVNQGACCKWNAEWSSTLHHRAVYWLWGKQRPRRDLGVCKDDIINVSYLSSCRWSILWRSLLVTSDCSLHRRQPLPSQTPKHKQTASPGVDTWHIF